MINGQKLVNHPGFFQNIGEKMTAVAGALGTAQTIWSAAKSFAPYIQGAARIGSALL